MSSFRQLALSALLGTLLACARPTLTAVDGGPGAPEAAERRVPASATAPLAASGSLQGRVLWRGPRPAQEALPTTASAQSVCGTSVPDSAFRVDGAGGVAEVVVWVDAPSEPLPSATQDKPVLLDQRGCLYRPAVFAARAGGMLRIRNSDALTHTVHASSGGLSLFNLAMPLEQMELTRQLPVRPGVVDFRCDVHPWMRATLRTFDHSHFTTTVPDGTFRLEGLPPGAVQAHAWHPRLGEASQQVQVQEGTAATDFVFGGKP
ncbi:MAG: hypothetical protein ACLPM8_07820 [Myxococcaceae bacterium]